MQKIRLKAILFWVREIVKKMKISLRFDVKENVHSKLKSIQLRSWSKVQAKIRTKSVQLQVKVRLTFKTIHTKLDGF